MHISIKSLLILLSIVLLNACGALASPANTQEKNSWINNPPLDTSHYFYAVGYGDTQNDAKNDALATISAKISVDVASKFSSSVSAIRQGSNEDVLQDTKNEVLAQSKKIEYTDVQIKKSVLGAKQWVVLVAVERDALAKSYERKLQKVDAKIKAEWEIFQKGEAFEKLKLSVTIKNYLREADTIFALLHALSQNFNDSKYTKRYLKYTKQMRKAQKELVFKIEADRNSESLASLIRSQLSAKNAKFSNTHYNTLVTITTKAKKRKYKSTNEEFANLTFALRKTTITVIDKEGNILSSTVYKTKEGSSEGFEDAIAKTAKYEKKIKQKGIFAFISGN